jgi:5-hydroxyisourate hydrolase
MAGKLTTHVLDTARGTPAAAMRVELQRLVPGGDAVTVADLVTNADGRAPSPLLEADAMLAGSYCLQFHVGDYFQAVGHSDAKRFLDVVPLVFVIDDPAAHYHVPLLVSPWAYSTYRGS